jgi:putative transposase
MPRPRRVDLAGISQHVVQRGVDRRPCFVHQVHYLTYLRYLLEESQRFACAIHAYVLMCNHVHLLLPPAEARGVGRLMQGLGRRYVTFFNKNMDRSGTLWDGRYKSCLVDSTTYLLRCYRYIELNPVRAGICSQAEGHRWSSYHSNGLGKSDPLVAPHPEFLALAAYEDERTRSYRSLVATGCPTSDIEAIRAMTSQYRAVGTEEFKRSMEHRCGRPMGFARRGRPSLRET